MATTVATIDVGGTGASDAANARSNLGIISPSVYANSGSLQSNVRLNFVNTATVTVSVTSGSTGNANISFTGADTGLNPFLLAGM